MNKKNKHFIRFNSILVAHVLLIICFILGCQPTPSTPPVIGRQKDILESIPTTSYNKIKTPEHISEIYDDFTKLKIIFDADVTVPNTIEYPVTEVKKRVFSDDVILSYIKDLAGKNEEIFSEWSLTKNEYMQKITEVKPYVESGKVLHQWLDTLQENYNNAETEVNNTMVNISDLPTGTISAVYVQSVDNKVSVFILRRGENFFAYYRDMFLETYMASLFEDSDFDDEYDTVEHFSWVQPEEPEISQEDAYKIALEYINKMGVGLDLYYVEPCTVLVNQVKKSTGWQFTFTKAISNMQAQYKDIGFAVDNDALPSYGAPWEQEICRIIIDKNGLCKLWWQGASEKSSIVIDSAQLIPFEAIKGRIVDQLNYMYGTTENGTGNGLDIKITEIELGISLISEKDKRERGVYLPTWYINHVIKWKDVEDSEDNWELNQIMFSALDGSYIEPRVTNTDLMSMTSDK